MRNHRPTLALSLMLSFPLAGCTALAPSSGSSEPSTEPRPAAVEVEKKADAPVAETAATATKSSSDTERSAPVVREDPRGGDANSTSRLVSQLNDTTREVATLRAANAKLKAAVAAPAPAAPPARAPDPADEKVAATVRSYGQFKQELAGVFGELEKLRAENTALTAQLKDTSSGSKDAKAAQAKLESELKAEKTARLQAEVSAAKLRDQLRAVATAVSGAGLTVESASADPRPRSASATTQRHVIKDGDTLPKLADRYYGDPTKWRVLLDANRGRLPLDGTMPAGLELEVPAK